MFWEHAISRRLMDSLSLSRLQHFSQIVHSTLSSSCNNVFLPAKISIVLELFCAGLHYNLWAIESVIGFQPTVNATIRQPFFTSLQTKNINQIRYKDVIHHHWGHTVEKEDHFSSIFLNISWVNFRMFSFDVWWWLGRYGDWRKRRVLSLFVLSSRSSLLSSALWKTKGT